MQATTIKVTLSQSETELFIQCLEVRLAAIRELSDVLGSIAVYEIEELENLILRLKGNLVDA